MIICFKAKFIYFDNVKMSDCSMSKIFFVFVCGDLSTQDMILLRLSFPFVFVSVSKKVCAKLKLLLPWLKSILSVTKWVSTIPLIVQMTCPAIGWSPYTYNKTGEADCLVCSTLNRESDSIKVIFCEQNPDKKI